MATPVQCVMAYEEISAEEAGVADADDSLEVDSAKEEDAASVLQQYF